MEYCGISINYAGTGLEPGIAEHLPGEINFAEIDGMTLANGGGVPAKITDSGKFIAVREILSGTFIRRIMETGGNMLTEFRESFRERLIAARDSDVRWVSADFGLNTVVCNDRKSLAAVKDQLSCFYGNLWENRTLLLLDVRWPWGGVSNEEWNRNVSFALNNLPFPNLGIAVNAHIHEAGVQENFDCLLDFLKAWRLHKILVRFHYEPELGNSLSGKVVQPVHQILSASAGDTAICACPLIKNQYLLEQEAGAFVKLLRQG